MGFQKWTLLLLAWQLHAALEKAAEWTALSLNKWNLKVRGLRVSGNTAFCRLVARCAASIWRGASVFSRASSLSDETGKTGPTIELPRWKRALLVPMWVYDESLCKPVPYLIVDSWSFILYYGQYPFIVVLTSFWLKGIKSLSNLPTQICLLNKTTLC